MYWKSKPIVDNRVEQRRKQAGITQANLAEQVNVTRQTIIALEKGDYVPSVALALALAEALDSTVERLFILKESI